MSDDNEHGHVSPSSSPPTPPSPLPVSVGPGNQKYVFSSSPSPSPPFSPLPSSHLSAENLPLLPERLDDSHAQVPSAFSLDMASPHEVVAADSKSSCLVDLLDWFIQRCCSCCSTSSYSSAEDEKLRKSEQLVSL